MCLLTSFVEQESVGTERVGWVGGVGGEGGVEDGVSGGWSHGEGCGGNDEDVKME